MSKDNQNLNLESAMDLSLPEQNPIENNTITHFGYEQLHAHEKAQRVAQVFDSVATKYDLMNDLMSFGIHRIWKQITIKQSDIGLGQKVLDLAGGTGDLTAKFSQRVGENGLVVLADINESMLKVGRDKLSKKKHLKNIVYVQANAESLPFEDSYFDCITIAFGLRNVTHKEDALSSMLRVLKPNGRLLILEFSKPQHMLWQKMYDLYSFSVLPIMGKLIVGDAKSYRYLAESIRMHPDQIQLKTMMEQSGFTDVSYRNMQGGIVALHMGFKK